MSQPSFDLEIDPTPTFRVSELTASIGTAVRRSFPEELWVRGEIDSLSRSARRPHLLRPRRGHGQRARRAAGHLVPIGRGRRRAASRASTACGSRTASRSASWVGSSSTRRAARSTCGCRESTRPTRWGASPKTATGSSQCSPVRGCSSATDGWRCPRCRSAVGLVTSRESAAYARLRPRARDEWLRVASTRRRQQGAGGRGRRGRSCAHSTALGRCSIDAIVDRPRWRQPQRAGGVRRRSRSPARSRRCRYR